MGFGHAPRSWLRWINDRLETRSRDARSTVGRLPATLCVTRAIAFEDEVLLFLIPCRSVQIC